MRCQRAGWAWLDLAWPRRHGDDRTRLQRNSATHAS